MGAAILMSSEAENLTAVKVLVPSGWSGELEGFLRSAHRQAVTPFAPERLAMLDALGQRILRHPVLRRDPPGAALGFWLRRAHLTELNHGFLASVPGGGRRVPAGLVLHIAPANVNTMFVLSWALSFLAGNANIVRLTTRASPLMRELLDCLDTAFAAAPEAAASNLFVSYEHDDAITTRLSLACDTRLVWGGDETVKMIRAMPMSPHAAERAFASKRSISVLVATAYMALNEPSRNQLADRMSADLAPFGQMACSSPHAVYWVGTLAEAAGVREDFVVRLEAAMAARAPEPDLGAATRRISFAFVAAAEGRANAIRHQARTTAIYAKGPTVAESAEACGAGLLAHATMASIEELGAVLRPAHQTITYFGLDADQRERLAILAGRAGADRLVPVGRALDFGPQWDGYDLWGDLTRVIVVQ